LARLALQGADDHFLSAAVLSSVNKKNLDSLLASILAGVSNSPPPTALAENFLRLAHAMGDNKTFVTLLRKVSTPDHDQYARWQFRALAGLPDTLDQRNSSLAKLQKSGEPEVKTAVQQLRRLFEAARHIVSDPQQPQAERLQAVRLLGRAPDHRQDDLALLA